MLSLANLTLGKRISLFVLSGLLVGLGLFSWLGIQSLRGSTARILDERLTIARVMASHLDGTLARIQVESQDITADRELPTGEEFSAKAKALQGALAKSGIAVQSIILIDKEAKILQTEPENLSASGIDMSEYPEVRQSLKSGLATISGLLSGPFGEVPVVFATTPIFDGQGKIVGALIGSIDLEQSSSDAFKSTITVGKTGYTELVDGNGIVLARTQPGTPPELFERSDHPGKFAMLIEQGKPMVGTCHRCHETGNELKRRRDVLAFAPLSVTSWGVAIRQSEEEALAPTRQLEQRLLLVGTVVLIATFSIMWMMMQGIVKPVRMLTFAAKKVAAGDFQAAIPVKRQDEIGQLSAAFYTMTQELAKSRSELLLRNEELKSYAAYVMRAQEEERQRIARELHDETIQSLLLLCRRLDAVPDGNEFLPASVVDALREARGTAEEVVNELRDFTKALRPPILDDLGMVTSIRRLLADFTERSKIKGQLKVAGEERRLASDAELGMFRITQEALRNVERHAEATRVVVTIAFAQHEVRLEVVDNGVGFSMASVSGDVTARGQMGLLSMQERAELLGGKLEVQTSPGKGAKLTVSVPVADNISGG